MAYKFQSLKRVLDVFEWNTPLWVTEISECIGKSTVIVHKYLKELIQQGKLQKVGTWPKTKYVVISPKQPSVVQEKKYNDPLNTDTIGYYEKKLLNEIFLKFSPEWKILKWFDGMQRWCLERWLHTADKIASYTSIYEHIQGLQNDCGLLDASKAFGHDFETVYLDTVYYADQYKWMDFWRGKLAEMTFYAKQSQNKVLISESIDAIIHKLECVIAKEKYSAIGIVPWSVDRKNQLLKILKNRLKRLNIPFVNIVKYSESGIVIPQKSLKNREQRMQNARNTIFVDDKNIEKYDHVFLIDDFVWSGSTLNETAKKLKQLWVNKVDGFAFVGNLNLSYEVINEI